MHYFEIAIPAPLKTPLTYSSKTKLVRGQKISVPLRKRSATGMVIKEVSKPDFETKEIIDDAAFDFKLNDAHLSWLEWISDYYHYPLGLVINSIYPPLPRKEKRKETADILPSETFELTPVQKKAVEDIHLNSGFKSYLLHGVTGSGKTEIYMELFEEVINRGKQGVFLLPEISLTPQLEKRFIRRFGNLVSVYHSQMTARQKTNSWYDFMEGKTQIMIGPRSSLFCPSENIELIVVDEEHESSFKQEEKFLYHARDAALKLAQLRKIPIVLGSATPSFESLKNVRENKMNYIRIKEKVFNQATAKPKIVDMTKEKHEPFWLSSELKTSIENHIARKKQVALFLNRRGWASMIQCYDCGQNFQCMNCDVSLTVHNKTDLYCHYCGYGEKIPERCPNCTSEKISKMGLGTEQVIKDLGSIFPTARLLKFDRDEIQNKNQLAEAILSIEEHRCDIIVGTQMIAKGLDFTNLTLMGILDADQSFSFPDFRASEKSLQQILQVLGRVGRRKEQESEVIIQTRTPEHFIFSHLDEKKFEDFSDSQIQKREMFNYPPFAKMVAFLIKAKSVKTGERLADKVAHLCNGLKQAWPSYKETNVLGPCPSPIPKIRNEYRFQVILKFPAGLNHQHFVTEIDKALGKPPAQSKISINVDPVDLM
jgi:primosomal protein N' (replication factor Y)